MSSCWASDDGKNMPVVLLPSIFILAATSVAYARRAARRRCRKTQQTASDLTKPSADWSSTADTPRAEHTPDSCVTCITNGSNTIWLAAINNFGIGGANAHVLLEPNPKVGTSDGLKIAETIPRIVNICGRTDDAVNYVMDFIQNNPKRVTNEFLALLAQTMKYTPNVNSSGMPYRGSLIITKILDKNNETNYEYKRQLGVMKSKNTRPLWLLFPGLGGQWSAMAKALMPIKIFADKVEECHQILNEFGIDLKHMLLSDDKTAMSTMTAKFCSTTAIEIALFEVMKALDITPDGIIGHSFGEIKRRSSIACAYADGCLDTREAMVVTSIRGIVTENTKNIPKGLMAVVGLPVADCQQLLPNGVYIACNNAKDSVVISGLENEMKETMKALSAKRIFVRQLESSNIAYHSKYIETCGQPLAEAINKHIPEPKPRSTKWLSTSLMVSELTDHRLKCASGEYFAYNLVNPVQFYDRIKQLPADAIVLELGPHSLFGKIATETLGQCSYVSLIKKDSNDTNMDRFLRSLATLYELGVNLSVERLYPRVEWPVARNTPAINSLIKWDHRKPIRDRIFPERWSRRNGADANVEINCSANDYHFYLDHSVDGQPILPATGYLLLAWRKLAYDQGKLWHQVPVVFENVQFKRAVFLNEDSTTKLTVKYFPLTGDFCIYENDNVCVSGKMRAPADDDALTAQHTLLDGEPRLLGAQYSLQTHDIYTELRIIGLEYGPAFQRLRRVGTDDYRVFYGRCQWDGNFVTYMDALLQSRALSVPFRKMLLPVLIRKLTVDPRVMFDAFNRNKCGEEGVKRVEGVSPTGAHIASNPSKVNIDVDNEMGELGLYTNDQTVPIVSAPALDTAKARFNHRFSQYKSEITFYYNSETKQLVAPGVELEEVIVAPVARRHDTTGLVLDTDEFYANDDNHAIDHCLSAAMAKYLQVCKSLAVKVKQLGFAEMKCDFNYDNLGEEVIQEFRKECNENHVMFRTFDKILTEVMDKNRNKINSKKVQNIMNEIQINSEYDMSKDVVNQIQRNERMIRALVEIFSGQKVNQIQRNERMIRALVEIQWFGVLQAKQTARIDADKTMDTVWLLAQDSSINGIIGLMNCLRLEPGGKKFRYIFNMDTNSDNNVIDFNSKPYSDILANDLAANVIKEGKLGTYRHFKVVADYDKCVSNDYYLNSGAKKDLTGIEWFDSRKIPEIKTFYTSDNKEVRKTRVEIYCAGISFHEVMLASGRITPGAEQLFTDCVMGCEYVGRRVDTGERVMGIDTHRTFATSVNANIHSMTTIPEHWSMAEAATIVGTYCTVYYALIKRANLKQ
ncbi:unnamed protein product, partial [Medioppia subpectinata]